MDSFLNMVVFDVWNGPDIARVLSQRPRASSRNVLKDSNCKLLHWHKTGKPLAVRRGKRTGLKTRHYGFQEVPEAARLIQSIVWEPEYGNSWGRVERRFRTGFHQI